MAELRIISLERGQIVGGKLADPFEPVFLTAKFFRADSHESFVFQALDLFQHEAIEFFDDFLCAPMGHDWLEIADRREKATRWERGLESGLRWIRTEASFESHVSR